MKCNSDFPLGRVFRPAVLTCLVLLLGAGCVLDNDIHYPDEDEDQTDDRFAFLRKEEGAYYTPGQKRQTTEDEEVAVRAPDINELSGDHLKVLETPVKPKSKAPVDPSRQIPFYEDFILLDADEKLPVSLVFNGAPLIDVIPAFADILNFNFAADADLKGAVTLNLNTNFTRRELWNTFDKILFLAGAGVSVSDSVLRIMPLSKLAQQPDLKVSQGPGTEICYFPLQNTTAKDIVLQIKPFLGKDSVCVELTRPNAILVADDRSNIAKIDSLLELLDRSGKSAWPRAVIQCRNILPGKIVEELKTVLPILGFYVLETTTSNANSSNAARTEQPGSIQLAGIDRLQVIVASAATDEAVREIRNWVDILDSAKSLDQERVFVYKIMHNKSDYLLQALETIYNTSGTSRLTIENSGGTARTTASTTGTGSSSSSRTGSTTGSRIGSTSGTTTSTGSTAGRTSSSASGANNLSNNATSTQSDQESSIFDTPVRVFADGVLNRLVIRTTPRTYASIKALLDRLDVVPAQVLLQVLVVEVTLTKSTEFGITFSAQDTIGGYDNLAGQNFADLTPFTTSVDAEGATVVNPTRQTGFTYTISDPNNPQNKFGYIRALAGNSKIKVVSNPQVLVTSNAQAVVRVGSDVPYVASALTNTASISNGDTTYNSQVEYRATGVTLTITPQITSTDLISLEVVQELSSAVTNTLTKVDAPEFPTRIVQTTMTIQNGKTMVMGGLIQERKNDYLDTLPLINEIPILRRLFGNTDASVDRSEILVMVTGYIVNERSQIEDMIKRYNTALKALNNFDNTLGDRPGAKDAISIFEPADFGLNEVPKNKAKSKVKGVAK